MMDFEEINHRFLYHPATTPKKQMAHESIRHNALDLAAYLNRNIPDGREKSLALTKIEEAMFWANAAVARAADTDLP